MVEPIDALMLVGDGKASKSVYGGNKAFLEIEGVPLFLHVMLALMETEYVKSVTIVGPKERIGRCLEIHASEAGRQKPIIVIEQKETLYENFWNGFISTIPGYRPGLESEDATVAGRTILVAPGDVPLISKMELAEFISKSQSGNFDYCVGITSKETLERYFGDKGWDGNPIWYLPVKEGYFRINNLHLAKPFKIENRRYVERMYELRYQKDFRNIAALGMEFFRKHTGYFVIRCFILAQASILSNYFDPGFLGKFFKNMLSLDDMDMAAGQVLRCRFKHVITNFGGAAMDVDSETDFEVLQKRFTGWKSTQAELLTRENV